MNMYVLCRSDLRKYGDSYPYVQGMHALAGYCDDYGWENDTLIVLRVKDEDALDRWRWRLDRQNKGYSTFCEPDIGGELTAIACEDDGKIFRKLQCL